MTINIINILEVVNICHKHGNGVFVTAGPRNFLFYILPKGLPV